MLWARNRKRTRLSDDTSLVIALLFACTFTMPLSAEDVSFTRDIAPILASKCYECHGPDAEQRKAGLRLDVERVAKSRLESESIAILPHQSDVSELIRRVRSTDDDRMPPEDAGEPLTESEVNLLTQWIDSGAEWQGHWAFEPLMNAAPPQTKQTESSNPIDQFILAKLEASDIKPAPEADRHTLLRRLSYSLTGLPPNEASIQAFATDARPDAYEQLVDRLIASPEYGERWGRHWLDVARYGDSNGGDENHAYPYAHRYRDYVIDVFNEDLAYDQFITEQLAGDLLPPSANASLNVRRLTATGYLAIGMKILAEQDPVKKRADMVDEQIDTFGRTFLGLSLGCARCHDHKFDPIPTADYYALAGIFHSSEVGDRPLPTIKYERQLTAFTAKHDVAKQQLEELQKKLEARSTSSAMLDREAESFDRGNVIVDKDRYGKGIGIISDPGEQPNYVEYDFEVPTEREAVLQLRYAAETGRPGEIVLNGDVIKTNAINNTTGGWMPEHQRWSTEAVLQLRAGKNTLRIQSEPNMSHIDRLRLLDERHVDLHQIKEVDRLTEELAKLEKEKPQPTMVMAMTDGKVGNTKLHVRGSHLNLADEIPRRFLKVLDGTSSSVPADRSGRLQLAHWLTENETAATLTSRVIVNRIWHWNFGRGLVTTPDDFGIRGNPPSHPLLLDYLARYLIKHDWSLKALHRLIVNSKTYRMRSDIGSPHASQVDPTNTLYWKRNRIRFNAESIRDSLLFHSDRLAKQLGDAPMMVKSQDPSPQDMAANLKKYEDSPRRSVYLPVVRSNVYEFFTLFDFPNASTPVGKRNETTIPTQALWMMNSPFMAKHAEQISRSIKHDDTDAIIRKLYLKLFCRNATEKEISRGENFIEGYATTVGDDDKHAAVTAYCQVLLASNDYLYLD